MPLAQNLRSNRAPLLVIGGCIVAFVTTLVPAQTEGATPEPTPILLRVGLYKRGKDAHGYFKELEGALRQAFPREAFDLKVEHLSNLESDLLGRVSRKELDIVGELSPIEFVSCQRSHDLRPFLGIEYEGNPFYHSVLFVPENLQTGSSVFRSGFGIDNVELVKELVAQGKRVAVLDDPDSTSGHCYPLSYLLDYEIPHKQVCFLGSEKDIYLDVLSDRQNGIVAGFMADFRFAALRADASLTVDALPLVIDKSDPIPNGVFAITEPAARRLGDRLPFVAGKWKSLAPIRVGGEDGPRITSWRRGIDHELDLVAYHKNRVVHARIEEQGLEFIASVTIVFLVLLVSGIYLFFLSRERSGHV